MLTQLSGGEAYPAVIMKRQQIPESIQGRSAFLGRCAIGHREPFDRREKVT
jgi:hypothetical protein